MRRIDIHHHFFPVDLDKKAANEKVGWCAPAGTLPWNPDISLEAMNAAGIDIAILSLPAISAGTVSEKNRTSARDRNIYASGITQAHPDRFGFFASLPFLDDVDGRYTVNRQI